MEFREVQAHFAALMNVPGITPAHLLTSIRMYWSDDRLLEADEAEYQKIAALLNKFQEIIEADRNGTLSL